MDNVTSIHCPRSLVCGHSVCHHCLHLLPVLEDGVCIMCPCCRTACKYSNVPPTYALFEAIRAAASGSANTASSSSSSSSSSSKYVQAGVVDSLVAEPRQGTIKTDGTAQADNNNAKKKKKKTKKAKRGDESEVMCEEKETAGKGTVPRSSVTPDSWNSFVRNYKTVTLPSSVIQARLCDSQSTHPWCEGRFADESGPSGPSGPSGSSGSSLSETTLSPDYIIWWTLASSNFGMHDARASVSDLCNQMNIRQWRERCFQHIANAAGRQQSRPSCLVMYQLNNGRGDCQFAFTSDVRHHGSILKAVEFAQAKYPKKHETTSACEHPSWLGFSCAATEAKSYDVESMVKNTKCVFGVALRRSALPACGLCRLRSV